ncbi:hypothetical protein FHG87_017994 [Trinorchestia longiramus]|nr:hypothetical protein FHG87_017994 [Trinorchestia longiramus]
MGKNKDNSHDLRKRIVELHNESLGYQKISAQLYLYSFGWNHNKLVRTVVQRPQTTREELKGGLKASGSKPANTRSAGHYTVKVFAPTPLDRTPFLQKRQVWRQQNEEYSYKPKCTIPSVEFGGGSIMVWGCFSSSGVGKLHIIEGTMNGRKYREILEEQLLPSTRLLKLKHGGKFEQYNDPKHTVNETKGWLMMKKINILGWPSQSPDMNPIENCWRELKLKIQKRGSNNIAEFKEICIEEWNMIMPQTCKRLVVNYHKRIVAIINNKGYATKY